jgi:hypothetical protein
MVTLIKKYWFTLEISSLTTSTFWPSIPHFPLTSKHGSLKVKTLYTLSSRLCGLIISVFLFCFLKIIYYYFYPNQSSPIIIQSTCLEANQSLRTILNPNAWMRHIDSYIPTHSK